MQTAPPQADEDYQYETGQVPHATQDPRNHEQREYQPNGQEQDYHQQYAGHGSYNDGDENCGDLPQQQQEPVNYGYEADETSDLFRMADGQKDPADAETLEQYEDEYYEEEEEEEEQVLTEDAYSLLYTAELFSRTAFFALSVIFLQGGMLLVTLWDLVGRENNTNGESNRMKIPPGSSITVTVAQWFGMVLTVMLMAVEGDIVVGFSQLAEGYDDGILEISPNATRTRWLVTGILQLSMGVVLLIDSFILSMISTTVIDLVLNLTALYFLQEVDEMAFKLADLGILTAPIQEDCGKVKQLKQMSPLTFIRRRRIWKRVLLAVLLAGLMIPYVVVVHMQLTGKWLCKHVYIQFGDGFYPELAYYSGQFHQQGYGWRARYGQRVAYVDDTGELMLAYCYSESAWAISRRNESHCDNYLFKSSETETFDVIEVADTLWFAKAESTGDVPVDWIKVICNDCTKELCKEELGKCDRNDNEKRNNCVCHAHLNVTGLNCELSADCLKFDLDARTGNEMATLPGGSFFLDNFFEDLEYVSNFTAFQNMKATLHDRRLYVAKRIRTRRDAGQFDTQESVRSFMLFTGRRWVIYTLSDLASDDSLAPEKFVEFINKTDPANNPTETLKAITTNLTQYVPLLFSSPVNYGSEAYVRESGNSWVRTEELKDFTIDSILPGRPDDNQPVSARYLCSDCKRDSGRCRNNGTCFDWDGLLDFGWCFCSHFDRGSQCESPLTCLEFDNYHDDGTSVDGCFLDQGECNPSTQVCECANDTFSGNLCQYGGSTKLADPHFCSRCPFAEYCDPYNQTCTCDELFIGENCSVWNASFNFFAAETAAVGVGVETVVNATEGLINATESLAQDFLGNNTAAIEGAVGGIANLTGGLLRGP